MPKELQELTDGTYTLAETKVENQFFFFRNDHQVLGNVGLSPVELFSKYYIEKSQKEGIQKSGYEDKIRFKFSECEISKDRTIIRLTVSDNLEKNPNLRIVKGGEKESPNATKQWPNFFKRVTRKLFVKG